jgi:peptidoglycan pentaglycine glycine transferase (the first glycine)
MMIVSSALQWEDYLAQPSFDAHILQDSAWGELKAGFGWEPVRLQAGGSAAQVLFRHLPLGLTFAYIPRGPLGRDWRTLWPEVDELCRKKRAVFLKVEPDCWEPVAPEQLAHLAGFRPARSIQPARTVVISLQGSEGDWLGRMKPKTRYNIRLAERKGVVVNPSNDLDSFQRLMKMTGERDGFGVHAQGYYQRAYQLFAGRCALLQAEYEGLPLAAIMVFWRGSRAWYFYGASSDAERSRMPTYLLQWEAMRLAAGQGCLEYDLWGIPDVPEDVLEREFEARSDGLWGVYRFKRGFGGRVVRSAGAWDKVYQPVLYQFYLWWTSRRGGEGG